MLDAVRAVAVVQAASCAVAVLSVYNYLYIIYIHIIIYIYIITIYSVFTYTDLSAFTDVVVDKGLTMTDRVCRGTSSLRGAHARRKYSPFPHRRGTVPRALEWQGIAILTISIYYLLFTDNIPLLVIVWSQSGAALPDSETCGFVPLERQVCARD